MSNEKTISWQANEFRHYPKNTGWYVVLIAVSIVFMAFFIIVQSDIFAAVSLAIITVLIFIFSRQTPQKVAIELTSGGIYFGDLFYPYKQLKYFWVVHNERHQTVNFKSSALLNNTLILELENQNPEEVKNYLSKFLPEHSSTEATPIQKITHTLKF